MAKITYTGDQQIIVSGERLEKGGSMEIEGKVPKSLTVLRDLGVLTIEGETTEDDTPVKVKTVTNPEPPKQQTTAEQAAAENDQKVLEIMRGLTTEELMADGRPDVRTLNEKLAAAGLNNISAADRDRIWALNEA